MKAIRPIVLAIAFLAAAAASGETIRSLEEINAFIGNPTPRKVPFEVVGKVQSAFRSPKAWEIILADDAGVRGEFYRLLDLDQPEPGCTIRAVGMANMGRNHEPYVRMDEFEILDHGPRLMPVDVRLFEANAQSNNLMAIRTEGVVIDAFPDEIDQRYMILLLKDRDAVMPVSFSRDIFGDMSDLVDAKIRVSGIYRRSVRGIRKFSWPNIHPLAPEDIEVVVPPPEDPFAAPPLEERLYLTADDIALMPKRSVSGEVLATWAGDCVMVRDGGGRIVNLTLAKGQPIPPCGEYIVAVGQPETDLFRINLAAARWKAFAECQLAVAANEVPVPVAEAIPWEEGGRRSIRGEAHGELISASGVVRTLPSPEDAEIRFVLDADGLTIPVDATTHPGAISLLSIGCEIKVTGRCILLADSGRQAYSSSRVRGFAIVIRSPADIVVLKRPPWWTRTRLMVVISVLLAALAAICVWNRLLRRLADCRGRELCREQIARAVSDIKTSERTRLAVELHDSLSQSLSGVACHLAAADGAMDGDPAAARKYVTTARKMLGSCRTELRQCLFDLRGDTLEEPDFSAAMRKALGQIDCDAEISIRFDVSRDLFPDTTAHAILAIARELVSNAIRHGEATKIEIVGAVEEGMLRFTVRDNGKGFDPASCAGPLQGHFGLEGIRTRLEKLGGSLSIDSKPGCGAMVTVQFKI